jgi:hypothetical protein
VLTNNVIEPLLDDIPGLAKALLYDVVDRLNAEEERAAGAH